jgi:hypothetical protein
MQILQLQIKIFLLLIHHVYNNVCISYNTVVSNHFHSVNFFLFSSARSCDFDGLIGIELPVSMYTTKTPIDNGYVPF